MKPFSSQVVIFITLAGFTICIWGCNANLVATSQNSDQNGQQQESTDDKNPRKPLSSPKDNLPEDLEFKNIPLGLSKQKLIPKNNPLTKASVALGRKLFFDAKLSVDGTVSCATCHRPEHGFASPEKFSVGVGGKLAKRNSPSVLNRVYSHSQFWDGRAESLEKPGIDSDRKRIRVGKFG